MSFDYKKIFFAFSLVIIQSSITFSQSGYELEFDGDDDYVETPGLLGEPANVTLAAWAKVASNQRGELISLGNHVAIRLNGTNKVAHRGFFRGTSTWHATGVDSTLAPGWHFFTYTNYDSSGTRIQKFYIDGNQVARTAVADAISYTGDGRNTRIGMHGSNNTYADFHGSIDDVGVWSKGLTSLEVKSLFNNGQIRGYHLDFGDYISKDKLLANWDFSEGVGSTLGANVTSAVWKPVAVKTIDSLKVMAFDTEGDRLYSVHPGTNSSADKAAVVSIVDLNTNEVIAQGGQFSMTEPGFNGYPKRIAVFDGIGVVGEGLMMFDFREDSVKYMGTDLYSNSGTSRPKDAMHFQKFGDHLYVTLQSYGFAVFDMSNPEKPVLVHEKDYGISGAYPYGIHANEKHIFLSDITTDGGKIYIHKNGEDFSKVGEISTKAYRMATYGNILYADNKKLFDISDLDSPTELTGLNYSGESSNGEMYIFGDYLVISGGGHKGWGNPRASMFSIKDRSNISLAYAFNDTLPSYDIKIHNSKIYVAIGTQGTEAGGIQVYENENNLNGTIYNALWKTREVKKIDYLKVTAFDIERDRLYSVHPGTYSSGDKAAVVSIVDLNTNEVIAQGGQFSMTEPGFNGYPKRIAVFDGIGVVGEGLMMFDFREDSVKYMGTDLYSNSGTSRPKDAMHFQKFGDHLYVTLQSYGFAVFDMSNPEKPVLVHEKDYGISGAYPYGIHANEKHIFLSDITTDGGKIYIHKNGEDFSKVGEISTKAYRMATYGNLIYTDKKKVFDISDLANPVKLTGLNYSGESSNGEMYITGDFLLVSGGGHKGWSNPRASIYNIKNFSDITLAYTFDDTLPSYDMKIHEGRIYVAFGTQGTEVGGIKIFDNDFIPIEDVYVAMDGNNETGSGSYLSPFRTIKKALEVTSKVYKLSDKPKYTEFNSGDKKFTDNGDFSSSYVVSPTVWVKKGVYRIEKDISVSSADDQQFVQIHVIRSIDGADSTILKPAWKNYTTENGVNYSSEGFTAGTLGYLELHGFTIDSLNLNYINGEMIVYNSLVKYVKSSGRSGSAKYLGSTIFDTELGTNIQTHIHSSIILNPIKVGNNIRMANTLYDTSLSILTGYAFNVNKTWSEGWAQDNVAFKYGGKNDPQFCDNRTYRYYDTSVANRGEQFRNLKVGAGVGCDKPGDFHWLTERFNYVDITQENLSENLTLGWDESTSKFGDVHYELYARINIYPYELVDETSQTTLDISYQDILDNAFTENTPGSDVKVYFTVYAIDGPDTVQVGNSDRIAVVNRYGYLSIESLGIPDEFALHENYPNPFNPTTQIRFDIPEMSNVNLTIYNMLGQKVKVFNMESAPAGYHALTWNATNELGAPVSAGVYLYQLQTKGFVKTKKMVLLK